MLLILQLTILIIELKEIVINITDYNLFIGGRNFYDQSFNSQIKKYDEIRKISTGQRDDYATGYLLDYQYFKDHYQFNNYANQL